MAEESRLPCRSGLAARRSTRNTWAIVSRPPLSLLPGATSDKALSIMPADSLASDRDASARILILFNEPVLPLDHPDADSEHEIHYTVDEVHKVLDAAGFEVSRLVVCRDPEALVVGIREQRPDVVFNLF